MVRDLDRLKDPSLKDPLVAILSRDADGRTRREAVETLAVFYDDPQVRGLVERLKDTDPEPEVRDQAVKQLGRWQSRNGQ
jgi:HEAT repeat protein